jgi:hypothetical protein
MPPIECKHLDIQDYFSYCAKYKKVINGDCGSCNPLRVDCKHLRLNILTIKYDCTYYDIKDVSAACKDCIQYKGLELEVEEYPVSRRIRIDKRRM